ncbi:MAG: NrfD/PsrC family molybdoenzyme membrane anchor subunit [Candidatus Bathyarchaeia archaeon]
MEQNPWCTILDEGEKKMAHLEGVTPVESIITGLNPAEGVVWGLLIATYPFITGIVAGSFIISTLGHTFGKIKYLPLSGLSLIVALAFLIAAPLPLIMDLGRPERAFNIFLTPSASSAMAVFGFLLMGLLIIYIVEAVILFRPGFADRTVSAKNRVSKAIARTFARAPLSPESFARHMKAVKIIGAVTLPIAALFHAYVGFIFGSVKARELWATPLTPMAFLISAIVSGIALITLIYVFVGRKEGKREITGSLLGFLAWVIIIDLAFVLTEVSYHGYLQMAEWQQMLQIHTAPLFSSSIIMILFGAVIPLVIIAIPRARFSRAGAAIASILVLAGVFAFRYNLVIGGQLIPKLQSGLLTYTPTLFEIYGSILAVGVAFAIVIILALALPWRELETRLSRPH